MKKVVAINKIQFMTTNVSAFFAEMIPLGISRIFVRTFSLSNLLSAHRLNAMAALRAKIMQRITSRNNFQFISASFSIPIAIGRRRVGCEAPKKKPIIANGIAKIVWLNFTRDK